MTDNNKSTVNGFKKSRDMTRQFSGDELLSVTANKVGPLTAYVWSDL